MVYNNNVFKKRQFIKDLPDLGQMFSLCDDCTGLCVFQPDMKRFISESGEQRLHNTSNFQDSQKGKIKFRDAVHEQTNPVFLLYSQVSKKSANRVASQPDIIERVFFYNATKPFIEKGHFIGFAHLANPVGTKPPDVDNISVLVIQFLFRNGPVEILNSVFVGADI
ncbi:hypothetical protein ES705_10052 [subsurface metagenome]